MHVTDLKLDLLSPGPCNGTLGSTKPVVSWKVVGDEQNWYQSDYQLRIRYEDDSEYTVFPSETSSESQNVNWPGRELKSKEEFLISCRVKGTKDDQFSEWSDPVKCQVGSLEWKASFIALEHQAREERSTATETLFRKQFSVSKTVSRAKLWCTAAGIYEVEINGQRVAEDFLNPGFTTYEKRLLHQMYDVTNLLSLENAIGARVGAGWYSGKFGFDGGMTNIYGDKRAISLVLDIRYEDGTEESIATDNTWNARIGPSVAGLYDGEFYDANAEVDGWSEPGADSSGWGGSEIVDIKTEAILPQSFPHVTAQRKIVPVECFVTPSGKTVVDFGENIVGFVEFLNVSAPKGYKVTFKHAEVLENGELGVRPLREAKCTDVYIFKGGHVKQHHPRFTFHGFRYCQIEDPDSVIDPHLLKAVVISTNMKQIGDFSCDNALLNQLHSNVVRSSRGNFITLPMDCPQRDERMGWTGDIALFGQTAAFLFDCLPMLCNWLQDVWAEQQLRADREFPYSPPVTVPDVIKYMKHFWDPQMSAIWQDCTVMVPKKLYDATGDVTILKRQYESMERWIEAIPKLPEQVRWDKSRIFMQLGDWLDPSAPPENPVKAMTDSGLVADAFLFLILTYMVDISAKVQPADVEKYRKLQERCRHDFRAAYLLPNGNLISHTQTAYSLGICFGLLSEPEIEHAGQQLAAIVAQNDFKIGTGFAGTPFVTKALFGTGHLREAYAMLLQTKCPSWLYPVVSGATTVWERWDSMKEDGSINPGEMTSFNHYALGAVATTMHEVLGGVQIALPGYKKFIVRPEPGGDITQCTVSHDGPYGMIRSEWKVDQQFHLEVTVPLNTSAEVILPNGSRHTVGSGHHVYECDL